MFITLLITVIYFIHIIMHCIETVFLNMRKGPLSFYIQFSKYTAYTYMRYIIQLSEYGYGLTILMSPIHNRTFTSQQQPQLWDTRFLCDIIQALSEWSKCKWSVFRNPLCLYPFPLGLAGSSGSSLRVQSCPSVCRGYVPRPNADNRNPGY